MPVPGNLEARRFKLGGDEFLALSFPIPDAEPSSNVTVGLTPSEQEICSLVLLGHSNSDIARIRGTSPRTIANQIAAIYRKIGVGSRRELRARNTSAP
jgi:DNA-binding CsgD family transcriptional regulator